MELRSNHHLHYISAIKGGKVVKILNVTPGRSTLSFKDFNALLDPELNTKDITLANRSLYGVVGEIVSENSIDCRSDKRNPDLDDIFLDEMTLMQLKKRCKAKKAEIPRSVDKVVKREYRGSQYEENGLDLEETLGNLKRKISGKFKSRKMRKCESDPKTRVVKSEPVLFDQDSLQISTGVDMCSTIKVEVSEPDCNPCQEPCSSKYFQIIEHGIISTGMVIGGPVTRESCNKEEDPLIIVEEPEVSNADPVSCEHHTTAKSLPFGVPVCEEMMVVDEAEIIVRKSSELLDPDGCLPLEESESSLVTERKVCILNQTGPKFREHFGSSCLPFESSSHEEVLKVDDPVMASDQPMSVSVLSLEGEAIADLTCNESSDILFPWPNGCASNDNCVPSSLVNRSSVDRSMSPEPNNLALCMPASSHMQPVESSSDVGACTAMDSKEYMIPGNCGMPLMVKVESMDNTANVSRSIASENNNCSDLQHPPERLLSTRKSISPDSQQKLCRDMRSTDSPDYQENEKCKKRLSFEKQKENAHASSNVCSNQVCATSTVPEHMNTADISPNSEQKMRRGKEDKRRVRANKAAQLPTWYGLRSGCACMQGRSHHVVSFAQQQMNDIERLAARLAKDLRSMKEIVIETLLPEARRTSKHNVNEVRIAVENASKVEETTRRLLGTMSRDCNRFCKIISLGEKDAAGSKPDKEEAENKLGKEGTENSVGASLENRHDKEEAENDSSDTAIRGRKKIKFADESGGSLCNVRLIEDQRSLLLESPTENGN